MAANIFWDIRTKTDKFSGHECIQSCNSSDFFLYAEIGWRGNIENKEIPKLMYDTNRDFVLEKIKIIFENLFVQWSNVWSKYTSTQFGYVCSFLKSKTQVSNAALKRSSALVSSTCSFLYRFFSLVCAKYVENELIYIQVMRKVSLVHYIFKSYARQRDIGGHFHESSYRSKLLNTGISFLCKRKTLAPFVSGHPLYNHFLGTLTYTKTRDGIICHFIQFNHWVTKQSLPLMK